MAECGPGLQGLGGGVQGVDPPAPADLPECRCGTPDRNWPTTCPAGAGTPRPWCDCRAVLHRFAGGSGPAPSGNRRVETPGGRAVREGRAQAFPPYMHRLCRAFFARCFTSFVRRSPAGPNGNVARFGERLAALRPVKEDRGNRVMHFSWCIQCRVHRRWEIAAPRREFLGGYSVQQSCHGGAAGAISLRLPQVACHSPNCCCRRCDNEAGTHNRGSP